MTSGQGSEVAPVTLRQIGVGADGSPLYVYADRSPVVQPQTLPVSRPWGAYVALGIGASVAVTFLAMAAAVLAVAVSIGLVSVTICILVLRSMWQQIQADRK